MKIKMVKTVRDTFAPAGTVLYSGSQYLDHSQKSGQRNEKNK